MIKKKLILIFFSVGWFSFSSADPGNYNPITGRLMTIAAKIKLGISGVSNKTIFGK